MTPLYSPLLVEAVRQDKQNDLLEVEQPAEIDAGFVELYVLIRGEDFCDEKITRTIVAQQPIQIAQKQMK